MAFVSGHKKKKVTVKTNTVRSGLESNSTLSSTRAGSEYEVFLSFRGPDTRERFTDHLYHRMIDNGIHVFKDNVNLPVGEEVGDKLLDGIRKSKISIPIFSENYAASKWCLKELAFMVECRKKRNQLVLPVFYDVTPHQIRHQTGTYAAAFSEHAQKYDKDTIKKWKGALAEVGHLKGWDLKNETAGREGELTKMIVEKVLVELKKAHVRITNKLVGIYEQERDVMDLLDMSRKDVRMVGIWGMGGVGKTTLAKCIYNQIVHQFDHRSFLNDIRETSRHDGLERLQNQLLSNLLGPKPQGSEPQEFSNVDEGVRELERRLREKKVLILLDDVDDISQLDALAGELNWFGPGSRIIVTTRNKDVLDGFQRMKSFVTQENWACYEVTPMNKEKALQLFCRHAFRQDNPTNELSGLSKAIVETTGGLPLALEVIGSSLIGKEKRRSIWEETLKLLKQAPQEKVQEKLKISYDMLTEKVQQMFLDVACLFIGEDVDDVMQVWKDLEFPAEAGKDDLVLMSLIKIQDDNKIWMHDQLRDLGREIVRQESVKELEKRSRLWHESEARKVLEMQERSPVVEALHLHSELENNPYCVKDKQIRNFPKLRFLQLYNAELAGNFELVQTELRWLRWRCPGSRNSTSGNLWLRWLCLGSQNSTSTNLFLENLLVLDLSFSMITDN